MQVQCLEDSRYWMYFSFDKTWIFIGRTDSETPILWPPDSKNWLTVKDSDAGKDWRQEEKGTVEGEMDGWHHHFIEHEFEWTSGVGDRQGGLVCCSPWGCKESDMTERLNWTELSLEAPYSFHFSNKWKIHITVCPEWGFYSKTVKVKD